MGKTKRQNSNKYIEQFLKLHCAPELISTNFFPNLKEISESMGAFKAVSHCIVSELVDFHYKDEDVRCVVIGDGASPRTGALFACRTTWKVSSVDPQMKMDRVTQKMNLSFFKDKRIRRLRHWCENFEVVGFNKHFQDTSKKYVLVFVHSHAPFETCYKMFPENSVKLVVSIPCCFPQDTLLEMPPDVSYDDFAIQSPKRNVKIWTPGVYNYVI